MPDHKGIEGYEIVEKIAKSDDIYPMVWNTVRVNASEATELIEIRVKPWHPKDWLLLLDYVTAVHLLTRRIKTGLCLAY